ncbi:MAG: circadian clock KaiB family protein [Pseudomonadota bacterium]
MPVQKDQGDTAALEAALLHESEQRYIFVLFVAGTTPNSMRAIANTREMCERLLPDRHSLTIIDMYQQPELARAEQIIAAPTLLRKHPQPIKRLVGTLADVVRIVLPIHRSPSADTQTRDAS